MSPTADRFAHLSPLQRAYLALEEMQGKLDVFERAKAEPIAIIGIGCRFPGDANSPAAFWDLLHAGVDAITEVPADRWDIEAYYDPDPAALGKMSTRWGGFLTQVNQFDAAFFGISPREAISMDPQQRLLLEVVWEALEDAGQAIDRLAGSPTGVFIGLYNNDYAQLQAVDEATLDAHTAMGNSLGVAAGRLSYTLDLQGPSLTVDTLCSSSLVAIHLACQSLRHQECQLAVAGGVNLMLSPLSTILTSRLLALAPDGRCKTFDARANGFVRGEGCGVVVLKRLSEAIAAGDPIWALIRGSAVNQDGRSTGLTAPNALAQQTIMRQALNVAAVKPEQVGYIEAHGTGTSLGDPIEVEALRAVYGRPRPAGEVCALGAVKGNIGHLEAAAGVAGLIKAVLALHYQAIPAQLHFRQLNPRISLANTPFIIPTTAHPWPRGPQPRLAGVSSFGISGTNAHVVLEEAPPGAAAPETGAETLANRAQLLPLAARSPEALQALARAYETWLEPETEASAVAWGDICYTASVRRSHHTHRLALMANSRAEAAAQLATFAGGGTPPGMVLGPVEPGQRQQVAFVFPGQGGQWLGMGRELLATEPIFRAALEQCEQAMQPYVEWSLLAELAADEAQSRLAHIDVVQPTLFALQVALAALWRSWGIEPTAVIGHSMGEVAAAHVAGILSLQDAAGIICRRSRLLTRVSGQGAMAVVELSLTEAQEAVAGYPERLAVAVSNGPRTTVLSGEPTALREVLEHLERRGIFCRRVKVDVASHSPQMDPLQPELLHILADVQPQPSTIPLYSTVTGTVVAGPEMDATYWVHNLRQPVRFWEALQHVVADGRELFLELSPHPVLSPAIDDGLRQMGQSGVVLPSLRREEGERAVLLGTLGALYTQGQTVAWNRLFANGGHCVRLPSYRWQRERFWVEEPPTGSSLTQRSLRRGSKGKAGHLLLGEHTESSTQPGTHLWTLELGVDTLPYLRDHRVAGMVVLPASAYLAMAVAAATEVFGAGPHVLEQVAFKNMLALPETGTQTVQTVFSSAMPGTISFQISSRPPAAAPSGGAWTLHATGTIRLSSADLEAAASEPVDVQSIQMQCQENIAGAAYYEALAAYGLGYGPSFQGVTELWRRDGEALARVRLPQMVRSDAAGENIHPVLLDACFQVLGAAVPSAAASSSDTTAYLPVRLSRLHLWKRSGSELWAHARLDPDAQGQGEGFEGDVLMLDEFGQIVVEARGFRVQPLDMATQPMLEHVWRNWLYELQWQPKLHQQSDQVQGARPPTTPGSWLIFADHVGVGEALVSLLEARGETCIMVTPGDTDRMVAAGHHQLHPAHADAFRELLREVRRNEPSPCRGVIHLWSLEAVPSEATTAASLEAAQELGCLSVLHLVQAMVQMGWRDAPRLWLVTRGTQAVGPEVEAVAVAQSPLWGLGRTIAHEHPEFRCTSMDLSRAATSEEIHALFHELWAESPEDQLALRREARYVARLVRWSPDEMPARPEDAAVSQRCAMIPAGTQPFRLEIPTPGILDHLQLRATRRRPPGLHEVEIQVCGAGLSFLDVLSAMGLRPDVTTDEPIQLGAECTGTIVALGEGVEDLQVGDEVIAIAPGSFGSFVTTAACFVVPKPARLSFEEAATIPIAFLTAYYALYHLGRLKAGERILIHSAASGTGLAAVQLAQRLGAEIFATAGNAEKRDFLRSLGIPHVMDSRSLTFADEVLARTAGRGVDVVLNSLTGEAIAKSLDALAPDGRFLEIGKKDIYQNLQLGLAPFRKRLSYFAIDLAGLAIARPGLIESLLRHVVQEFAAGELNALPLQVFPITEAEAAFRTMAQAKHIGKIVISLREAAETMIAPVAAVEDMRFGSEGTYLLSGGLGGLGLTVAQWLVAQGIRHLALVGRTAPTPAAAAVVEQLRAAGAAVLVAQADVAEAAQLADVLTRLAQAMPPLRGVVHAAAVLDDGILLQMTPERVRRVLAPKVQGAWNLHALTREAPLEQFVLFSSAASLLGAPGQGNYAAANAFLDALAQQRRAQGLPALSINWGPWAEVGLAAAQANRGQRLAFRGVGSISPSQGLEALGHLLRQDATQVAVVPLHLRQWRQFYPTAAAAPLFSQLVQEADGAAGVRRKESPLRQTILAASPAERRPLLESHVVEQISQVLRLSPTRIDTRAPLTSLGLDSLMALELRNRLEASLGLTLPATLAWNYPTVAALAPQLLRRMGLFLDAPEESPAALSGPGEEPAASSAGLEQLSEEQLLALFDETLAKIDTPEPEGQ